MIARQAEGLGCGIEADLQHRAGRHHLASLRQDAGAEREAFALRAVNFLLEVVGLLLCQFAVLDGLIDHFLGRVFERLLQFVDCYAEVLRQGRSELRALIGRGLLIGASL